MEKEERHAQYTDEELAYFMKAMKKMSDVIRSEKPDHVFAPILGSVPLVDILHIVDRHFPLNSVEYPPNSSRFQEREGIMDRWYSNFLDDNYITGRMSILCVDEVISGSSASKGYNEFAKALHKFGERRGKRSLEKRVVYKVLGIGEMPKNGKRNHNFTKLVNQKKAKVFETPRIITADNINLNPVRLRKGDVNRQGRTVYLPEIEFLEFSQDYMTLLYNAATHCGVDPSQVTPVNVLRMNESLGKYLRQNHSG
jgi:hypothetical protein